MFNWVLSTSLGTQYTNTQTRQTRQKLPLREKKCIIYRQIIAKYLLQSRDYEGYRKVLQLTTTFTLAYFSA